MIVKDIADVKSVLAIHASNSFENIQPELRATELDVLKPLLGTAFYNEVENIAANLSNSSGELRALVMQAIVNLTYGRATDKLNLSITDSGFAVTNTEHLSPASQARTLSFKKTCFTDGYNAIELMLQFLEENEDDFETWRDSDERKATKELLVPTATVFNNYVHLKRKFHTYHNLRSLIRDRQTISLEAALTPEFITELVEQQKIDGITDANAVVLPYIQAALTHFTAAEATRRYTIATSPEGMHFVLEQEADNIQQTYQPNTEALEKKHNAHIASANGYIQKAIDYMRANANDFPTFNTAMPLPEAPVSRNNAGQKFYDMG